MLQVNHVTGESGETERNAMVEAARISRGGKDIKALKV